MSGTQVQSIPNTLYSNSGVAADIPTASALPEGSLYYETDTGLLKQVQSGAWVKISPLIYVEIAPVVVSKSGGTGSWVDWDLSASIPANAIYAEISAMCDAVGNYCGIRENGGSTNRKIAGAASQRAYAFTTKLDSSRYVEVYDPAANSSAYWCTGYWM